MVAHHHAEAAHGALVEPALQGVQHGLHGLLQLLGPMVVGPLHQGQAPLGQGRQGLVVRLQRRLRPVGGAA